MIRSVELVRRMEDKEGFLYKATHVYIYKELYEKSSFMVIPPERQIEGRN